MQLPTGSAPGRPRKTLRSWNESCVVWKCGSESHRRAGIMAPPGFQRPVGSRVFLCQVAIRRIRVTDLAGDCRHDMRVVNAGCECAASVHKAQLSRFGATGVERAFWIREELTCKAGGT